MKYIKNRVKYVFAFLLLVVAAGCENELYQSPIVALEKSEFYSNEGEIESAVIGVYDALQSRSLYGNYIPAIGEVPSDNTTEESEGGDGGNYFQLEEFAVSASNSILNGIWKQSYVAIGRANIVLNRIPDVEFEVPAAKNAFMGEMKFVRALMYFNQVRLFGDVPLVIEETVNPFDSFGQPRTPVDQVYAQIELDLTEAIALLPVTGANTYNATKGAAQALLGKIYLTRQNYAAAKTQFDAVINSYALVADINNIFGIENENNSEYIFAVPFISGINGNREGSDAYYSFTPVGFNDGRFGHNIATDELISLYDPADLRLEAYFSHFDPFYSTAKLDWNESRAQDGGSDCIVLRTSDITLCLAEVENELGNSADATTLLNSIRTRAGLVSTTATSQSDLRDAIALERRFELAIEGHRWFDLVRTGKAIEVMANSITTKYPNGIVVQPHELIFPIPQGQLNTDPALVQNPGYD